MTEAFRVRAVLGDAHLINLNDGVTSRRLECRRCLRTMGEQSFSCLGPRFTRTGKMMTGLHPYCHTCRKQRRGKWIEHPLYTPELDRFWSGYFPALNAGANVRSIYVGLDAEDLLGAYLEQDGLCALTGIQMEPFKTSGKTKSGKHLAAPSVDRIDSQKRYTPDNIQIVLWSVNMMKGDLPQEVFIELCRQISIKNLI